MHTYVFVDGFNLYYGCLRGTPYKWLDLSRLFATILKNTHVDKIYYFTARIKPRTDDPDQNARQETYLRAIRTIENLEIVFGHFLSHAVKMPTCNGKGIADGNTVRVLKTEEKGSDVNLASYLLLGAAKRHFEQAIIVSNDSDLLTPIRIVRQEFGIRVGLLNPHKRPSQALRSEVDFIRPVRIGAASVSQFPKEMTDDIGSFSKPEAWN